MTLNIFDRALFGDTDQFDVKISLSVGVAEPAVTLSDIITVSVHTEGLRLIFNSRIRPTEDVSI